MIVAVIILNVVLIAMVIGGFCVKSKWDPKSANTKPQSAIIHAIESANKIAKERGWEKTFWAFDIHGTIIKPNYKYGNVPKEFYPYAKQTLQLLSKRDDIVMILYTCSHPHEIEEYLKMFAEHDIYFKHINENPDVKTEGYGCYDKKFYFNVLFEDKAGFNPNEDWQKVYNLHK